MHTRRALVSRRVRFEKRTHDVRLLCVIGVVFGKSTVGPCRRDETAGPVGRADETVDDGVFLRYL